MPETNIDKSLHLLKLAALHSRCSLDFGLELQNAIMECDDIDYLLTNLTPIIDASIRDIQSSQLKLHSIQRQKA